MARYAEKTTVNSDQSLLEIKRTVERYGATGFGHAYDTMGSDRIEMVEFKLKNRRVRFLLTLPPADSSEFMFSPTGRNQRTATQAKAAWEQAVRQRWRAL